MIENIIALDGTIVKESTPLIIRAIDKRGKWTVEATFQGGTKVTSTINADGVNTLESNLKDLGWLVDPSLFHRGFNAKPPMLPEDISEEDWGELFVSGLGLWVDDLALEPVAL